MFSFDVSINGEINLDLVLYGLEKDISVEGEASRRALRQL
jgi:hypothetical protein